MTKTSINSSRNRAAVTLLSCLVAAHLLHAAPWVNTGPLNVARHSHTATLLLDGKVLVAGGFSGGGLASVEIYDRIFRFSTNGTPVDGSFVPLLLFVF